MKFYVVLFSTMLLALATEACDRCAIALGMNSQRQANYIGLSFQSSYTAGFVPFSTRRITKHLSHVTGIQGSEVEEYAYAVSLIAAYTFGERFIIEGRLPVNLNNRYVNSEHVMEGKGTGDQTILAHSIVVNTTESSSKYKQWLTLGAGVKFPLGQTQKKYGDTYIDHDMQPGTGSYDFLGSIRYLGFIRNLGFGCELMGVLNTPNLSDYRYGHELRQRLNLSYNIMLGSLAIIPTFGSQFEWHESDFQDKEALDHTGGKLLLANGGMEFQWKTVTLSVDYLYPLSQQLLGDQLLLQNRINFYLRYNIKS